MRAGGALYAGLAILATHSLASAAPLTVSSEDGSLSVVIDDQSGSVTSLNARGLTLAASASATLAGTIDLQVSAKAVSEGVVVSRLVCIHAEDVPCSIQQALIQELFSSRPTSIGWTLNVSSPGGTPVTPLWGATVVTNVSFAEVGDKKFWAPWERGNGATDPLTPSDGGYSWWKGEYLMGAEVVTKGVTDRVIHEMATVLSPAHDVGVSFIPNPGNPPAHPTWLNITSDYAAAHKGAGGAGCSTPGECPGSGSFSVSRHHLRFGDAAADHIFDTGQFSMEES